MRTLACILMLAVSVSGCAIAGRKSDQVPTDSPGWNLGSEVNSVNDRVRTAEFSCGSYKYKLTGGIWVSEYHWFGPPFLPIFPPLFAGGYGPQPHEREFDLSMNGEHADTFRCPTIKIGAKAYKGEDLGEGPGEENHKYCRYRMPTPEGKLTFFMEDQMGCNVTPLHFKLTPDWFYHPIMPGTFYR